METRICSEIYRLLRCVGDHQDFVVQIRKNWSSKSQAHRMKIHRWIEKQGYSPDFNCDHRISITHCPILGGAILHRMGPVGIDIEITSRVDKKIIARVASEQEIFRLGLPPAVVWTAKEAIFKCGRGKFKVIGEVSLISSRRLGPRRWLIEAQDFYCMSTFKFGLAMSIAVQRINQVR